MRYQNVLTLLALFLTLLGGCSKRKDAALDKRKDAALEAALSDLTLLSFFADSGVTADKYSDQLSAYKAKIDLGLQKSTDLGAKGKIEYALTCYTNARNQWGNKVDDRIPGAAVKNSWADGAIAIGVAKEYAFADKAKRQEIDKKEKEGIENGSRNDARKVAREELAHRDWIRAKEARDAASAANDEAARKERDRDLVAREEAAFKEKDSIDSRWDKASPRELMVEIARAEKEQRENTKQGKEFLPDLADHLSRLRAAHDKASLR